MDAQVQEINRGLLAQFKAEREQFSHAREYLQNESYSAIVNGLMSKLLLTLKKDLEDVFMVSSTESQSCLEVENNANVSSCSETN